MKRYSWHFLLLILVCSGLSACGKPEAQAMLEDYAARVSRVLEVDINLDLSEAALAIPALPQRRERLLPTTEIREGVLDVWDFEQCGMMNLIAERNSSLGKVMAPSQKMRYEIRFIQALQNCQAQMQAIAEPDKKQREFIQRLDDIYAIKQANFPAELWNGLYTSEEISQQFALGKAPLPLQDTGFGHIQRALEQLHSLAQLSEQNTITPPQWLSDIEDVYFTFYRTDYGAQFLTGLVMLTQTLDRTATAIEQRMQQSPFCPKGHQPRRATILFNVFRKYYAGEVQPYMALIQREGQQWLTLHHAIMDTLPPPPAMQRYRAQVLALDTADSLWQQWQAASQRHTDAWQAILGQCDLMPKAPQDVR